MKAIIIPARSKALNELFKKARRNSLLLQAADGQRFVLASVKEWQAFEVGGGNDFSREVELTVQNKKLMSYLARRRRHGNKVPLSKVKEQLKVD